MEVSYSELRQMETVNISDGKRLGKVCDVVFTFSDGRVSGIVVPGGKGLRWGKPELFISMKNVVKIGVDVVLVEIGCDPVPDKKKHGKYDREGYIPSETSCRHDRRDYGEYE